ncbi:hypothetical protein GCM10010271_27420 [Streptomyces kurssanovii]|nr:hypothetical protein GCM10010271_27420 [Streptomyces kurssanovii]
MADTWWSRFQRHPWLPGLTAVAVLVAVLAAVLAWRADRRASDNAELLSTVCAGVLPDRSIAELLPEDERWVPRADRETVGAPRARQLMTCSVEAGDTAGLTVTAVPVMAAPLRGVRVEHLLGRMYEDEPEWAVEYQRAGAHLTVGCPEGLPGHARHVTAFRVHASLRTEDGHLVDGPVAGETVDAVADHIRRKAGCSGDGAGEDASGSGPDYGADAGTDALDCDWLRPGMFGKGWVLADQEHGAAPIPAHACSFTVQRGKIPEKPADIATAIAATWYGGLLAEARTEYGRELASVSIDGGTPDAGARRHELAVWAEARCFGRTTLHRASVTSTDARTAATTADRVLGQYLESASCRDTKILGKVWV